MSDTPPANETPEQAAGRLFANVKREGYKPIALHTYTDANGTPQWWKVRLKKETGEKYIRPFWKNGAGYQYGEPKLPNGTSPYPNGKPLYNLQALASRTNEPVVIVEGENCVDALVDIGVLATTSGNCESAEGADWSPLEGRKAVIWPDNDEAGSKHAFAVASKLWQIRKDAFCSVPAIEVRELNLPPKGDAVDWLGAHPNATAEDIFALKTFGVIATDEEKAMDRQTSSDIEKTKFHFPNADPFTEDQLERAKLAPPYIVDKYLYHDVAILVGAGGSNKTTIALWESAHIALGRTLYGLKTNQSRTLFVTGEDNAERLAARLRELMKEMNLGTNERKVVLDGVRILDLVGKDFRFCDVEHGSITTCDHVNRFIDKFSDLEVGNIYFDPLASFGPSEELGNSGFQGVINATRRIVQNMKCGVRIVHHTGQESFRANLRDQYSMRGATSLSDGSRMVAVLTAAKKDDNSPFGDDHSSYVLSRPKVSFCEPQGGIFIKRTGFRFEYFIEIKESAEQRLASEQDQVEAYLVSRLKLGERYSQRDLVAVKDELHLTERSLKAAVTHLRAQGRIVDEELPKELKWGRRQTYLFPVRYSKTNAAK